MRDARYCTSKESLLPFALFCLPPQESCCAHGEHSLSLLQGPQVKVDAVLRLLVRTLNRVGITGIVGAGGGGCACLYMCIFWNMWGNFESPLTTQHPRASSTESQSCDFLRHLTASYDRSPILKACSLSPRFDGGEPSSRGGSWGRKAS